MSCQKHFLSRIHAWGALCVLLGMVRKLPGQIGLSLAKPKSFKVDTLIESAVKKHLLWETVNSRSWKESFNKIFSKLIVSRIWNNNIDVFEVLPKYNLQISIVIMFLHQTPPLTLDSGFEKCASFVYVWVCWFACMFMFGRKYKLRNMYKENICK